MPVGAGTGALPAGDLRRRGGLGGPGAADLRVPGVVSPADAATVAGQPGRAAALAVAAQPRAVSGGPPGLGGGGPGGAAAAAADAGGPGPAASAVAAGGAGGGPPRPLARNGRA